MQLHQQGNHGWSVVHESMALLAEAGPDPSVDQLLAAVWRSRPLMSDSHLITLLGIALRVVAVNNPRAAAVFEPELPAAERANLLAEALRRHHDEITSVVTEQSNSYTGARRFLVPQLVLGAYAEHHRINEVRLLDMGTGIGLLPRQLNNRAVFERFAPGLEWDPQAPRFRPIPLTARYGVDAPPLPTLDWVRSCHGPSAYYTERFSEVVWSLEQTESAAGGIGISALDILDLPALTDFLRTHRINVVTCNFVLYQYDEPTREKVIAAITSSLGRPGLFLSMEPGHELRRMGAQVRGYLTGGRSPLHVADVSDAHFVGRVTTGPGFAELTGVDRSS
ncbi:hypothetical protein J7I97_11570 [Streptomyces sp. ISL-87]|nr:MULTISPECIES: hypothetical protein [unclassified Streptomyces]MBT2406561.1 hypothetical protein [Streptomyces sp. ISL-21]MBT2458029.1 hypothetical protein [Streptomyces sp. ISL-86]MBT2608899.1 hypothetical protein [Streptomyces sp. ISL-87]